MKCTCAAIHYVPPFKIPFEPVMLDFNAEHFLSYVIKHIYFIIAEKHSLELNDFWQKNTRYSHPISYNFERVFYSISCSLCHSLHCSYSNATSRTGTNDAQLFFHMVLISQSFNAFSKWIFFFLLFFFLSRTKPKLLRFKTETIEIFFENYWATWNFLGLHFICGWYATN